MRGDDLGSAVVDVATTGLFPGGHAIVTPSRPGFRPDFGVQIETGSPSQRRAVPAATLRRTAAARPEVPLS